MSYVGDIRLGDTIDIKFTTVNTSGVPTTLAGTPVVSAYPGNSVTQLTAGITLTVDFDAVTGLHNVRVVATGVNGYATATNYTLVITTGTVGGSSVVGYVVGEFSIENRSAVMPTVAARTLDVSATGEAGVDWANVGTPGSTVNLSATTTNVVNTAAAVTTVNGLAANVITAASIAAAAMNGKGDWNIGKTGYALSAAGVQAIWDALTTAFTTVGSIGKLLVDRIDAAISSRSSHTAANVRTEMDANSVDLDAIGTLTTAIKAQTDKLTFDAGNRVAANEKAINDDTIAAANLAKTTRVIGRGTAAAAATTTSIPTSALTPAAAVIDQFKGRIVTFDADTATLELRGQSTDITANTALGVLTVTALTTAPASGDSFSIT